MKIERRIFYLKIISRIDITQVFIIVVVSVVTNTHGLITLVGGDVNKAELGYYPVLLPLPDIYWLK
jgi:hypothetical protein